MSNTIADEPQPAQKKQDVPIKVDPVARSIARPDAFMKPGSVGKSNGRGSNAVRVRMSNPNRKGRTKKFNRDYRDVQFY